MVKKKKKRIFATIVHLFEIDGLNHLKKIAKPLCYGQKRFLLANDLFSVEIIPYLSK